MKMDSTHRFYEHMAGRCAFRQYLIILRRKPILTFLYLSSLLFIILTGCTDKATSLREIQVKAERGNAQAQVELGKIYRIGGPLGQNYEQSANWFMKSAKGGYSMGQYFLAQAYDEGQGLSQNSTEAIKWFHKAAEQGVAGAQYQLGIKYTLGQEVSKDFQQAVLWYRKAAEQGLAEAQYCLGLRYARGEGVPVDDAAAVKWYRKAAEQGITEAQVLLAQRHAVGEGVKKDLVEAYKWLTIAGEEGQREKFAQTMTPKQIKEAEKKAAKFRPMLRLTMDDPPQSDALFWFFVGMISCLYGVIFYLWFRKHRAEVSGPRTASVC